MRNGIKQSKLAGFTIIEQVIVIAVVAILVSIAVMSTGLNTARDSERVLDTDTITWQLERYYRTNAVSLGASYPPSTTTATALAAIINSSDSTTAPNMSTNSLVIASSSATQNPTISQYTYQALNVDGTLCNATPCVRYALYFRKEVTNTVVRLDSMRQQ